MKQFLMSTKVTLTWRGKDEDRDRQKDRAKGQSQRETVKEREGGIEKPYFFSPFVLFS